MAKLNRSPLSILFTLKWHISKFHLDLTCRHVPFFFSLCSCHLFTNLPSHTWLCDAGELTRMRWFVAACRYLAHLKRYKWHGLLLISYHGMNLKTNWSDRWICKWLVRYHRKAQASKLIRWTSVVSQWREESFLLDTYQRSKVWESENKKEFDADNTFMLPDVNLVYRFLMKHCWDFILKCPCLQSRHSCAWCVFKLPPLILSFFVYILAGETERIPPFARCSAHASPLEQKLPIAYTRPPYRASTLFLWFSAGG